MISKARMDRDRSSRNKEEGSDSRNKRRRPKENSDCSESRNRGGGDCIHDGAATVDWEQTCPQTENGRKERKYV